MAKKHLGQNFLYDPFILQRIIKTARLLPDDTIIEIGPGHGSLTKMLATCVKKVIAIELDKEFQDTLETELLGRNNIEVVYCDALKYPYEKLNKFKVVANIPYYITTPLLFKLLEYKTSIESITLMVQKEVADRILSSAGEKEYGRLAIAIQYYGKPAIGFFVPRGAFRPVPKTDSSVIHIDIYKKPVIPVRDEALFFRIVKTAFSQRRKTLANSLKPLSAHIKDKLLLAGIDPVRRPETLSIEEFARLSDLITENK